MKIGVLTFHHVPNYGSVLQAYALAKYLNTIPEVKAEIIDYRNSMATKAFFRWHLKSPIILQNLFKIHKFRRFIRNRLPLSKGPIKNSSDLQIFSEEYDAFIAGSDQIWINGLPRGYDEAYYLPFAPDERAFSFSASFGNSIDVDKRWRESVRTHLNRFKRISVRDRNSCKIVKKLTGRIPLLTCDPTLLVDFDEFIQSSTCKKPYLLLFGRFWWLPKEFISEVHKRGLILVSTGNYNPRADVSRYTVDPGQWINLVANATAVLTTYFHGTIFAIKYNRPFISVVGGRSGKTLKISSLLENYGLHQRLFMRNENLLECINPLFMEMPLQSTNKILEGEINLSKNYLKEIAMCIEDRSMTLN